MGFELPPGYSASNTLAASHGDRQPSESRPTVVSENLEGQGRADLEATFHDSHLTKEQSHTIAPSVSTDGTILVGWYSTEDPANPKNWSSKKKAFVALQIWYTFEFSSTKSQFLY